MYHPPSKKIRLWRRFSIIAAMAIVVIVALVVLTALTLGYSFNKRDGRIEQGGLLQIGSAPTGAAVTVNGTLFGAQTPTKLVSQPGDYALTLNRKGYRQWQKTVPIQAGNITWVTYPRLIPEKLAPTSLTTFPASTTGALVSPTGKSYAVLTQPDGPNITTVALDRDDISTKEYAIPDTIYTTPSEENTRSTFALGGWSNDGKKVLLEHQYGDNHREWLLLNLDRPDESINVSHTFGLSSDVTQPHFSNGDANMLYVLVEGSVRVLSLRDETVSRPLVENAVNYRLYDDDFILYVARGKDDATQQIGYTKKDYRQARVVKTVPYDGTHDALFDVDKYYDNYYYLIAHGSQAEVYRSATMPSDARAELSLKQVHKFESDHGISWVNMINNGLALVQDGYGISSYNLEVSKASSTQLAEESNPLPQTLRHLDSRLLWGSRDGKLRTYEFDGGNQQDIMPIAPEFDATLSPSGKYLYGFVRYAEGVALTRVQLLDIKTD